MELQKRRAVFSFCWPNCLSDRGIAPIAKSRCLWCRQSPGNLRTKSRSPGKLELTAKRKSDLRAKDLGKFLGSWQSSSSRPIQLNRWTHGRPTRPTWRLTAVSISDIVRNAVLTRIQSFGKLRSFLGFGTPAADLSIR